MVVSSSLSPLCQAIRTTIPKQITIETNSKGMMASESKKYAIIDIQNGLVYRKTMIKEIGAKGAASVKNTK